MGAKAKGLRKLEDDIERLTSELAKANAALEEEKKKNPPPAAASNARKGLF